MQFLSPIVDWLAKQRISLVTALTICLTFLVAAGVVAIVSLTGNGGNGGNLDAVEQRAQAEANVLVERARAFVSPLQHKLDHLEAAFRAGRVDLGDVDGVAAQITELMRAAPQADLVGFVMFRGPIVMVVRNADNTYTTRYEPGIFGTELWELDTDEQGRFISPILFDGASDSALIPFVRRVPIDDDNRLHIVVASKVPSFSSWMTASENPLGASTFGLYGPDRVLAHKNSDGRPPDVEQANRSPLPHVSTTEDPVLLALWRDETQPASFGGVAANDADANIGYIRRVASLEGGARLVSIVELSGLTDRAWLLGTSFPFDGTSVTVAQNGRTTGVVIAVMLALAGLAFLLARYISRPLESLAETAHRVSRLQLENIPDIPNSVFREFDDTAQAFKTMSIGLEWFQSYVPSALVRKLLKQATDGELLPETKELTIMFTDVAGFTQLSEQMEAQDIVEMLNDHFSLVGQCIDQEAGTIDKYIGDGLMAFWGAPDHQPDHAVRAVNAADAIVTALKDKNEARRDMGEEPICIRIGIFTGRVSIGNIGAPGRINYTVIGDAVNAAQRLERLGATIIAEGEEAIVLIGEETIKSIERNASTLNKPQSRERFEFVKRYTLDGRTEETGVYRIATISDDVG